MKTKIEMDRLGMCTSVLCIIHCIALPILLVLGIDSMVWWLENELFELALIGIALLIGLVSFVRGFLSHKQHFIPVLFVAGFLLLVNGHAVVNEWSATGLSIAGAMIIAYTHFQNLKWKSYVPTR